LKIVDRLNPRAGGRWDELRKDLAMKGFTGGHSPVEKLLVQQPQRLDLCDYLFQQVKSYMKIISKLLELSEEETQLFLHQVINQFRIQFSKEHATGLIKYDKDTRNEFEDWFEGSVLKPLIPAKQTVEKIQKESMKHNFLLAQVYQKVDLDSDAGESYRKEYMPNLILSPIRVDFDSFRQRCLTLERNKMNVPCLWTLSNCSPSLWVVRYLPDIYMWQKLLRQKYMRRVSKEHCRRMTVARVFQECREYNWGDVKYWEKAWNGFLSAWNLLTDYIHHEDPAQRIVLRHECADLANVIQKLDTNPNKVMLIWSLPDTKDEGICLTTMINHLVEINNRFLEDCGRNLKQMPVVISEVCQRHNLVDIDKTSINNLVRGNACRPLTYGKGNEVTYDWLAMNAQFEDKYLLGRGEIAARIRYFEFSGAQNINNILSTEFNVDLEPSVAEEVLNNFTSPNQRKKALEVLEEVIVLLSRLGAKKNLDLTKFMREVLQMSAMECEFFKTGGDKPILLKHLKSLWETLRKAVFYDDPRKHLTPENVETQFRGPLSKEMEIQLDEFIKDTGLLEMEIMVISWRALLRTVGENKYGSQATWTEGFLKTQSDIAELGCVDKIPDLPISAAAKAFEYVARKFFKSMGAL